MSGCVIFLTNGNAVEVENDFRKVSDSLIDNTSPDWITVHRRAGGEVLINGSQVCRVEPCQS